MWFWYAIVQLGLFCFALVGSVKLIGLGCHWIRTLAKQAKQKGDKIIEESIK